MAAALHACFASRPLAPEQYVIFRAFLLFVVSVAVLLADNGWTFRFDDVQVDDGNDLEMNQVGK